MSGRASLVADDGECESFHRSAQGARWTNHLQTPQVKTSIHDFAVSLGMDLMGVSRVSPWITIPAF